MAVRAEPTHRYRLTPRGPFDLQRSIKFLEDWPATAMPADQAYLRFACCAEQDWEPVGVTISAAGADLDVTTTRPANAELRRQIARILSVDVNAAELSRLGERDPVVSELLHSTPGMRPVCFWSPWEAACWAVLSQRTSMRTASIIKRRIATTHGTAVDIDGAEYWAFPAPQTVLAADGLPTVPAVKLRRLHKLARAALDGMLTAEHLRELEPEEALAELRELPGIGPFSAGLILIRGAGAPDVFTTSERRLLAVMRTAYDLPEDSPPARYQEIAESWRPFRSWIAFLLRSASAETIEAITGRRS